jgi:hypothetical protein
MAAHGGRDLPQSDLQETGERDTAAAIPHMAHSGKDGPGTIK